MSEGRNKPRLVRRRKPVQACGCGDPATPHVALYHWWRDGEEVVVPKVKTEAQRIADDLEGIPTSSMGVLTEAAIKRAIAYLRRES